MGAAPVAQLTRGSSMRPEASWGLPEQTVGLRVSMYQMASASLRAMLDTGHLGATLASEPPLGALIVFGVAGW